MTLSEILALDGIVIRKIPATSISLWSYREGDENRLKTNQSIVERNGRKFVREEKQNSLGGKYLIAFKDDQGSTMHFDIKRDGIGQTIEAAFADYERKAGT